jgi:hypothetical protein
MKKGSVVVESFVVFFVILCCIFIALPFFISTNNKEKTIVKWEQKFLNIQYAYDVLRAQNETTGETLMTSVFQKNLGIFLRKKKDINSNYKQNFMNNKEKKDIYIFDKFFENEYGTIVGFKWINPMCKDNQLCAVMSVDINGFEKPNILGKDVFGVNFYKDRVEPIGKNLSLKEQRKDCSRKGSGVYCSSYYLIGGLDGQ